MRAHLGWLTFLLAVAFAFCLIGTLVLNAWFDFPNQRAVRGFFAFGIPTMVIGAATALLWDGHKALQKFLGWAGTMAGLICAAAVLVLVVRWVLAEGLQPEVGLWVMLSRLGAFSATALVCGGFGIETLYSAEGRNKSVL